MACLFPTALFLVLTGLLHRASGGIADVCHGFDDPAFAGQNYGPLFDKKGHVENVCSAVQSKLTFPTANQGCFPNIVKQTVPVDPNEIQGLWYEFRSRFPDQQTFNARLFNSLVCDGSVYLPGTYTPAVHYTMDYRYITLPGRTGHPAAYGSSEGYEQQSQVNCNYGFLDALSGFAGNFFTNTFSPALEASQPTAEVQYWLFLKRGDRGFGIEYVCADPNQETYICDRVQLFVNTRVHPNQLTAQEVYEIEDTIDRVLAPYCMNKNDLQKVIHRPDLSIEQCNAAPLASFQSLVSGYAASLPIRNPSARRS